MTYFWNFTHAANFFIMVIKNILEYVHETIMGKMTKKPQNSPHE